MLDVTRKSEEWKRDTKRGDIAKIISLGRRIILDGYKYESIVKTNESEV